VVVEWAVSNCASRHLLPPIPDILVVVNAILAIQVDGLAHGKTVFSERPVVDGCLSLFEGHASIPGHLNMGKSA
jgi:hypothetical protein